MKVWSQIFQAHLSKDIFEKSWNKKNQRIPVSISQAVEVHITEAITLISQDH